MLSFFGFSWASFIFSFRGMTDWSDTLGFGVPTFDTESFVTFFVYFGYALPASVVFFWVNASYWEGGIKARPTHAYPYMPLASLLVGLASYALFTIAPAYALVKAKIDPQYYGNVPCFLAFLGLVGAVLTYEALGNFFFRCFRGEDAAIKPANEETDGIISERLRSAKKRRRSSISIGAMQDEMELQNEEPELSAVVVTLVATAAGMAVAIVCKSPKTAALR